MFGVLEGTGFEVIKPEFTDCFIGHARVERLWTGARWSEGPAWFSAGRYVVWSDIPNNRLLRWDETDGSIWFTDPAYGIIMDYEGDRAESEIGACNVYRVDPITAGVAIVADDFIKPNGLAFSADENHLFISDTGGTHDPDGPAHIRKIVVNADGKTLGASQAFAECGAGFFDGFRLDRDGRIWSSAGDGVHCLSSDGTLIGKINIPEIVGNLCFGGPKLNRLFMASTSSLYSVYLNVNGLNLL